MEPIISVVIPVYNVENYLDACVQSVLNQTFRDFEIILVDDGSADKSGSLCDKWAACSTQVSVIHKSNGGQSSARNEGILNARGRYICFLDSDDFIAKDWLENLYSAIETTGADIVKGGIFYVQDSPVLDPFSDNIDVYKTISFKNEECLSAYEYLCRLITYEGYNCVTNQLVKTEIYKKCLFPTGRTNEDHRIYFSLLKHTEKICICTFCGLYYRQRIGSTTGVRSQSFIANMTEDYICHHNILVSEYSDTENAKAAVLRATELFFYYLASAQNTDAIKSPLTKQVWQQLYPVTKNYDMKKLLPKVLYMQYRIYSISENLYYHIMRIKKAVAK